MVRHVAGGYAPLGATAWPDEVQIGGVYVDGTDLGTGVLASEHPPRELMSDRSQLGDLYLASFQAGGATRRVETFLSAVGARIVEIEHLGARLLIRGDFGGDLVLRGTPLTASAERSESAFVAIFDEAGDVAWHRVFEHGHADLYDASFLVDGDVVLVGSIGRDESIDFGGGPLAATDFNGNTFLARLGPSGEHRSSRLLATAVTRPQAVARAPDGGFVVAGSLGQPTDFGGGVLANGSSYATFLVRYDESGEHLWSRRYPEPGQNFIDMRMPYLAVAHDGSIVFGAECGGVLEFPGGGQLAVDGHFSPCVFSLDPQGGYRAGFVLPSTSRAKLRALAVDPWGRPVLLADFRDTLVFDGDTIDPTAQTALVIRADPLTMAPVFSRFVGGAGKVEATALAVASDGAIFVAGSNAGDVTLPDGSSASAPGLFLLRWEP